MPDIHRTIETWHNESDRLGVPRPYLIRVESFAVERGDPRPLGFDASVEFQPDGDRRGPTYFGTVPGRLWRKLFDRQHPLRVRGYSEYPTLVETSIGQPEVDWTRYRCVTPGWDNTPRRPTAPLIFVGSTPEVYGTWVKSVAKSFRPPSPDENFAFVNAWNEWAEGNHLEPDMRWGRQYLEAHRANRAG